MSSYWKPEIDYDLVEEFREKLRVQEQKRKEYARAHYLRQDFTDPHLPVTRRTWGNGQTTIVINQFFFEGKE